MITREFGGSTYRVVVKHGHIEEQFAGASACGLRELRELDGAAADGRIVSKLFFDGFAHPEQVADLVAGTAAPCMLIRGDYPTGKHAAGVQTHALTGAAIRPLTLDGRVVGGAYADDDAEYCWLTGILPAALDESKTKQAEDCFLRMQAALGQAGMDFRHVVRTWIYLASLLDWYLEFNAVRTAFFRAHKVFDGLVPASTGIGAGNHAGAAIVTGLLAMKPKRPGVKIVAVPSPLQCPALEYKSSFSRAVEIEFPDRRHLLVSGTASIAPDGTTVHTGDVDRQIDLTMRVTEALLQSRGMDWADVTRGIVYFRDTDDVPRFEAYCRQRGLPPMPLIFVGNVVVCRDDLLFEIEVDALQSRSA
jgi:enamine deaminase RidA (YjgF/YER057c/UK114 family)